MIEREEFAKVMATMGAWFPRWVLSAESTEAYYAILSDLPPELLQAAALEWGSKDTPWPPSAGQLRAVAFDLLERREGIPTAGEAWAEVLKHINLYAPPSVSDFSNPLVHRALQAIGGNRAVCMAQEDVIGVTRAHFRKAYQALRARERDEQRMLPQVREIIRALPQTVQMKMLAEKMSGKDTDPSLRPVQRRKA